MSTNKVKTTRRVFTSKIELDATNTPLHSKVQVQVQMTRRGKPLLVASEWEETQRGRVDPSLLRLQEKQTQRDGGNPFSSHLNGKEHVTQRGRGVPLPVASVRPGGVVVQRGEILLVASKSERRHEGLVACRGSVDVVSI